MASRSPSSSPDSGTDPVRPGPGEPLGGAGSDSDSDLGLDRFDTGDDLEREFESCADRLRDLVQTASRDQLLYLYARYKQVKVGKCNTPKPGFFDFEGQRKWQAWRQLQDMGVVQAMREYVCCVHSLDPEGPTERRGGFGGPAVSCLYQEEVIREEDKNIFDYCKENAVPRVSEALSSREVDVNVRDEEGRALLHWACDRGHKDLVSLLLQNKADINSQDDEGQTPLHYASACEFTDIVELLLSAGADASIRDQEGSLPREVTESPLICSLLCQDPAPKG